MTVRSRVRDTDEESSPSSSGRRRTVALVAALAIVAVLLVVLLARGGDDDTGEIGSDRGEETGFDNDDPGTSAEPAEPVAPPPAGEGQVDQEAELPEGVEPGDIGAVAEPVPIDAAADFGDGVAVRLASIDSTEVEGNLPGERSGPGVALTVEVTNGADEPINLDSILVDLTYGERVSAPPVFDPDRPGLRGPLPPGESRSGTYLFSIEPEDRGEVTIYVKYSVDQPMVAFSGALPG